MLRYIFLHGHRMTIKNLIGVRRTGVILRPKMWLGVDAMMLVYSIIKSKEVWRQQTQLPPVPQKGAIEFLKCWYDRHLFIKNEQVLVFVFDSRLCPFKKRRMSERLTRISKAREAVRAAQSLEELEKALPGT